MSLSSEPGGQQHLCDDIDHIISTSTGLDLQSCQADEVSVASIDSDNSEVELVWGPDNPPPINVVRLAVSPEPVLLYCKNKYSFYHYKSELLSYYVLFFS